MFNSVSKSDGGVRDRLQRATGICRYLLCSSLLSVIEEIKSSLVAHDRDSHFFEKNANTLFKSKTIIWKVQMGVCEPKTFESDTRSINGFGACEADSGETQF